MEKTFEELYIKAKEKLNPREISDTVFVGSVAAAILCENNKIYTGICIDSPSSMGFCAEHNAIGAMITDGKSKILKLIAVYKDGTIIPPCGRCREFIKQINSDNDKCEVMIRKNKIVTISELLPYSRI